MNLDSSASNMSSSEIDVGATATANYLGALEPVLVVELRSDPGARLLGSTTTLLHNTIRTKAKATKQIAACRRRWSRETGGYPGEWTQNGQTKSIKHKKTACTMYKRSEMCIIMFTDK